MTAEELKIAIKKSGLKKSFIAQNLVKSNSLITTWLNGTTPIAKKHLPALKSLLNIK